MNINPFEESSLLRGTTGLNYHMKVLKQRLSGNLRTVVNNRLLLPLFNLSFCMGGHRNPMAF